MKICFDTCVLLDIFGKSQWFFDSYCAYDVAMLRGFSPCMSASSTTDVCYLLHSRGNATKKEARRIIESVFNLFDLVDNTSQDCKRASASVIPDYEDALIAYSAYRANVDLIISRDVKGFKESPVAMMTPKEFVWFYKPDDIEYSEIDF